MTHGALILVISRKKCPFNTSQGTCECKCIGKPCSIAITAYKLKTFATFRVIFCTILFCLFPDVARLLFPRTMLVLGQYTSRDGSNSGAPVQAYLKLRSPALTARELPC